MSNGASAFQMMSGYWCSNTTLGGIIRLGEKSGFRKSSWSFLNGQYNQKNLVENNRAMVTIKKSPSYAFTFEQEICT
jgi:hypothetical protein